MQFNPWKRPTEKASESHGSNEAEGEFQKAAEQVASEAPPPVAASPSLAQKLEDLTVSEEHAREAVKACFWPMAHYVDPLWALSDAEAQKATPQMQKFLAWLLLKYAPLFTLKLAARFPELLGVIVAMATVAWVKFQAVEAAKRQATAPADGLISELELVQGGPAALIQCEVCGKYFVSRQALVGHLPCNPA